MRFAGAGMLVVAACGPRVEADRVLVGRFLTLDSARPAAEALAVADGRITLVGSRVEVLAAVPREVVVESLPGVAVPGLADAHAHPAMLGEQLERLDLRGLSREAIAARVGEAAAGVGEGEWILGGGWDQGYWEGAEFPTAAVLDAVAPRHPVLLDRIDLHSAWVNRAALVAAGISAATPDPPGGRILRDRSGEPTGMLVDAAVDLVRRAMPVPGPDVRRRQLVRALERYAAWGLTSVHDAGASWATVRLYEALGREGGLPVRVYVMVSGPGPDADSALAMGPRSGLAGGRLDVRSLKLMVDGALGSRGAQLADSYTDAPGERGLDLLPDSLLHPLLDRAAAAGFQVGVHALGDRAVTRVLRAFAARDSVARVLRFRLEHASVVRPADLPVFGRHGLVASLQPVFVGEYRRWASDRLGPRRVRWVVPTRQLLEAGAVIAAGTDFPASDTGDPLHNLYSMVTRRGADRLPQGGWLPEQKLTLAEALAALTTGPAWASFAESDRGRLAPGYRADLTILSEDPFGVLPDDLDRLRVLGTRIDGVPVPPWRQP